MKKAPFLIQSQAVNTIMHINKAISVSLLLLSSAYTYAQEDTDVNISDDTHTLVAQAESNTAEQSTLANETIANSITETDSVLSVEKTLATIESTPEPAIEIAPNLDLKEVVENPETITSTQPNTPEKTLKESDITQEVTPPSNQTTGKKFVLLGAEIPPSTSTRLQWKPVSDISDLSVPTPVLVINGANDGPTLCLTAAVHGDELNGIEIIRRVMYNIDPKLLNGKLIGVPVVNLLGFQRNSRYLPDRRDLNRAFPGAPDGSLAARIAYSLFNEVINKCDRLIDLHTGSMLRTNLPQIRAEMTNPAVAKFVQNFDDMLVIHSESSPGMLRTAANNAGIAAITMEVGESMRIQVDQIKAGTYSINSFLSRVDMYSRLFTWGKAQPAYYQSQWVRVSKGGILFSDVKLGDVVKKGDILGNVTNPINNKKSPVHSSVNGRIIGMAIDQVVMPGFAAYHVGIRATENELAEKTEDNSEVVDPPEAENPE